MTSFLSSSSPSSWDSMTYFVPQPQFVHAVDEPTFDYPPPPSPPSDGASTPRTPPQPALPIPPSPKRSSRSARPLPRSSTPPGSSKSAPLPTAQPWSAQPTISTFSASSSSFNHIHIVQPYVQGAAGGSSSGPSAGMGGGATDLFSNSGIHFVGMGGAPSSDGRPPRPANAWILYRSAKMKVLKEPQSASQPRRTQADISKLIAEMWKNETPEVKQYYEAMSDMKKAEHLAQYPTYRFQPMKKADKEKARLEKKAQKERERAEAALTRPRGGNSGRARRRQQQQPLASAADAQDDALDGQIAGFPPGTQVLAWGTTPTPVVAAPPAAHAHAHTFQPYAKPMKRAPSATRKAPKTPPSVETPPTPTTAASETADGDAKKPALTPLVTTPITTISPSVLSGVPSSAVSVEPALQYVPDWVSQTASTPYSAHPDYSYSSVPPIMTNFSTEWDASSFPSSSACATTATPTHTNPTAAAAAAATVSSLPPPQPAELLNLFTNPGAPINVNLPSDFSFDPSSGFELGQLLDPSLDLDQFFRDPATFELDPSTTGSEMLQQPPPPQSAFYEPAVEYAEYVPQPETTTVHVADATTPAYGFVDPSAYFHAYTPAAAAAASMPVYAPHQPSPVSQRKPSVSTPSDVYGYHDWATAAYHQTPWSVS